MKSRKGFAMRIEKTVCDICGKEIVFDEDLDNDSEQDWSYIISGLVHDAQDPDDCNMCGECEDIIVGCMIARRKECMNDKT